MKVVLSKFELASVVSKIQNVVPSKPAIPVLANILLEAVDGQLFISATDLTVSIKARLNANIVEEGAITLPAKRFFQLVKELTTPQIEIHSLSPETALIRSGSSQFKIQGMHKSEFPQLPDFSQGDTLHIPSASFKEMLSKTSFAAARDDSRQALNGVLLQSADSKITFISTDGKRLAKAFIDLPSSAPNGNYVIPIKAVEEIIRLLENSEEPAQVIMTDDKISIETGSIILISKLITESYPDVSRVIPEKRKEALALHREELISLLRQVALFTSETSSSVRLTLKNGELHLSAMHGEIGEGKTCMPANYTGEQIDIAFNPHYFLDILRRSKDETIRFDVSDSYNPGMITDSSNALFVLMPMRLEG